MTNLAQTSKSVCLECFGVLNESRICTSCQKRADDSPTPPHQLQPRTVLYKRYLIAGVLGEGGFGITYLAWNMLTGRKVAVKEYYPSVYVARKPRSNSVILKDASNQVAASRSLHRFLDEAKTLSNITNSEGIVAVLDLFSANDTAYIVMEYLDGISLKAHLKRVGKIDINEAISILQPILTGLQHIHSKGMIHRDISPDNIILLKNTAKLVDFGAAKRITGMDEFSVVLKEDFAPEEQRRPEAQQGPCSDIYALGATVYYALSGVLPPRSASRVNKDEITKLSELGVKLSKLQEMALMRALSVYSKNRYQTVDEFARDFVHQRRLSKQNTKKIAGTHINTDVSTKSSAPHLPKARVMGCSSLPSDTQHTQALHKYSSKPQKISRLTKGKNKICVSACSVATSNNTAVQSDNKSAYNNNIGTGKECVKDYDTYVKDYDTQILPVEHEVTLSSKVDSTRHTKTIQEKNSFNSSTTIVPLELHHSNQNKIYTKSNIFYSKLLKRKK